MKLLKTNKSLLRVAGGLCAVALLGTGCRANRAETGATGAEAGRETGSIYGYWVVDEAYVRAEMDRMVAAQPAENRGMAAMFVPMLADMARNRVTAFAEGTMTEYNGDTARSRPMKVVAQAGGVYTLESEGRQVKMELRGGRLVDPQMKAGKNGPELAMRRLTAGEIRALHARVEAAKHPPAATAPADDRLRFLVGKASPEQLDALLAREKDLVTLKNREGETALVMAVAYQSPRREQVMEKLLAAGADANADSRGKPVVWRLVQSGQEHNTAALLALLRAGAKVDLRDAQGETPLMAYCQGGRDLAVLRAMLDAGAPVNAVSDWKKTAFTAALEARWSEGVSLLLERGVDLKTVPDLAEKVVARRDLALLKRFTEAGAIRDEAGKGTVLLLALKALNEADEQVANFLKQPAAPMRDEMLKRSRAASESARAFVRAVAAERPASLTMADSWGVAPPDLARTVEVATLLVEAGVDPKAPSRAHGTQLHQAVVLSPELTRFYLDRGLEVNGVARSRGGVEATPLMCAVAKSDNLETIKLLLERGAQVNAKTPGGGTALSAALQAWGYNPATGQAAFDYLMAHGADPKIGGDTCLSYAPNEAVVRRLVAAGATLHDPESYTSPLLDAVSRNNVARVKLLLELGANPALKHKNGQSTLAWARLYAKDKPELLALLEAAAK